MGSNSLAESQADGTGHMGTTERFGLAATPNVIGLDAYREAAAAAAAGRSEERRGEMQSKASDIKTQIMKTRKQLFKIIALSSGQPLDKTERGADRDSYMTSVEVKAYGIVDSVIRKL